MLSRVADSLYWMSRYLERAENTARALDVHLNLVLELSPQVGQSRYLDVLAGLQVEVQAGLVPTPNDLTLDAACRESISSSIAAARENARQIREQISSEMFEQLNKLYLYIRSRPTQDRFAIEPHSVLQKVKDGAHLFQGITDSTMIHGQGWIWIQVGRYMERANCIAGLLLHHLKDLLKAADTDPHHYSELLGLLKSLTAWEAYCKVYGAELTNLAVARFLTLNADFPHSLHFCIHHLSKALEALAQSTGTTAQDRLELRVGRLRARLRYATIEELLEAPLVDFLQHVREELNAVHQVLYELYLNQQFARNAY
jgi:uncharacterized alpha-E superfamily protein